MTNLITKLIGDKRAYRELKGNIATLPAPYAKTMTALMTYMFNFAKGDGIMKPLTATFQMLQEAAAEGVPVAQVVGADPVAFADQIMAEYPDDLWLITYQNKLRQAVREAQDDQRD